MSGNHLLFDFLFQADREALHRKVLAPEKVLGLNI
jgi:hypothetical protein